MFLSQFLKWKNLIQFQIVSWENYHDNSKRKLSLYVDMIVQFNKKSIQTILKKFWKKSYRTSAPPCTHELLKSKLQKMRIFFYQKNVCHSGSDLEKAFCTIMVFKIVFRGSRYPYKVRNLLVDTANLFWEIFSLYRLKTQHNFSYHTHI